MKKFFIILAIIFILIGSILIVFRNSTSTSKIKKVSSLSEIKKGENVLISGKFKIPEIKTKDDEYKIVINHPLVKRIKSVTSIDGWKDEDPKYISNKVYINDVCISEEVFDKIVKEELISNYAEDTEFLNDKIVPMKYSSSKDIIYLTTMDETGFWRLRYYKREIDTSKTYTVIGKWDGEKVVPIEGMEKSIYDGEVQIEKFEDTKTDISINMYIGIVLIALGVILILIRLIIAINKK